MKSQSKRVATTPSVASGAQPSGNVSLQGNKADEKNNFSIAVALLAAQKQKKAGILSSHKNSIPENVMNISQEQGNNLNNHMMFQQIQNSSMVGNQNPNKLNQSFNKGNQGQQQQGFHLPYTNSQNSQHQAHQQLLQQNQGGGWNLSTSLNKSNILDTSYGNYMNQPVQCSSTQHSQQHQQQTLPQSSFSGQKYYLKNSGIGQGFQQQGNLNTSMNSGIQNSMQQTRPSLAQQKLNQLLDQQKGGGKQSPSRIAATEQSILTMNSSFNGNQKQYINSSYQGQQQFNSSYSQQPNPSLTLPAAYQNMRNSNGFYVNTSTSNANNPGQVSHTLQDASPVRKTRQSLELRTRPMLTEGNITSGSIHNHSGVTQPYNMQIKQQDQMQVCINKNNQGQSSFNQAPQPHYMLSKPNQKPYVARIYKQNKTSIMSKNDVLNTSKDRQQNQMLQSSLIESNRNNSYLAGSGGKPRPQQQQYLHLNTFNNNTQPASINRNSAISPVGAATVTTSINRPDSGIHNQSLVLQNPNSVKAAQSNSITANTMPPQPQYHHQKNSKSMTISKNSFTANFNVQSPVGNTTQLNLNSSKESKDYSFLNQNLIALQAQISQSPSIHSIQKKPKIQINNFNNQNNNVQQNSQTNPQQFLQQPRAQTQTSSRREQDTQKSNMSNPRGTMLHQQNQHSSASQLIDDQNLSNITTNFITINENNKSSPKIYAKAQQDSFRYYDEVLEEFIQKNRFSQESKLDYFDKFLMTLNEIQRRSSVNQKLNFSQQQQHLNPQQYLQMQQNLLQISSSHNTAASLFQNSTSSSASFRFFENLKAILESPIQNLLQESRQQKLEFEQKKSQVVRELDLERKERAVLEMKIDILEQEKDKLQNLVTTLSKQQQVNSHKSRNQSTNSHTNSHNTSHNNTSNLNNINFSNIIASGGYNLSQQEIQMLLAENEKLKTIAKKQRKKMNSSRSKEEKLMKLLYAIRKLGINVDEIYNNNVKTPDSLSPSGENQNRFQQKGNDFISPEHNHLSQFQPWELSQDHNISQNTSKLNQNQGQSSHTKQDQIQGSNKKESQPSSKRQAQKAALVQDKKSKQGKKEKPFYVNSQNEDEDDNDDLDNDEIEEEGDDAEEEDFDHNFSEGNQDDQDKDGDDESNFAHNQYYKNNHEISWEGGDYIADKQNMLTSPKQVNAEIQYKMKFQKIQQKNQNENNNYHSIDQKQKQSQQGRYSHQGDENQFDEHDNEQYLNQDIQFIPQNLQQFGGNFNKTSENDKTQNTKLKFNIPLHKLQQQQNVNNYFQQQPLQYKQQYNQANNTLNQNPNFNNNNSRGGSPQQNYNDYDSDSNFGPQDHQQSITSSNAHINQYEPQHNHNNDHDQLYSEKSVTDSELSIPINEVAYASQSNKMINAQMKDKLKINLGCLQVKDPANNNMHLNLGKVQNGEGMVIHEEIVGYHDEFMNKFDEFSQSWRDAINKEKLRYQNDMAPISHIYVSAL